MIATASRDCATFETLGYTVKKVQPVDMFANTGHVECVVLLSKTEKQISEKPFIYMFFKV